MDFTKAHLCPAWCCMYTMNRLYICTRTYLNISTATVSQKRAKQFFSFIDLYKLPGTNIAPRKVWKLIFLFQRTGYVSFLECPSWPTNSLDHLLHLYNVQHLPVVPLLLAEQKGWTWLKGLQKWLSRPWSLKNCFKRISEPKLWEMESENDFNYDDL